MLPSIAASSSGHWNQDGSRRWQRSTRPSAPMRTHAKMSPRKPSTSAAPSAAVRAAGSGLRVAPDGSPARICSISARLCSTSRMRIHTRALTSPACTEGTSNCSVPYGA
jgi:hypothetical protein